MKELEERACVRVYLSHIYIYIYDEAVRFGIRSGFKTVHLK
jgi:hypothetical protein